MNESDSEPADTQAPKKKIFHPDNLKKGGIWGAVITTIASLGYAQIQSSENEVLLKTNTELVRMVQDEAMDCRDRIIKAYERGYEENQ